MTDSTDHGNLFPSYLLRIAIPSASLSLPRPSLCLPQPPSQLPRASLASLSSALFKPEVRVVEEVKGELAIVGDEGAETTNQKPDVVRFSERTALVPAPLVTEAEKSSAKTSNPVILWQSSIGAARADNFYYPPEWTPSQGSLNKSHGQHALRERASNIPVNSGLCHVHRLT